MAGIKTVIDKKYYGGRWLRGALLLAAVSCVAEKSSQEETTGETKNLQVVAKSVVLADTIPLVSHAIPITLASGNPVKTQRVIEVYLDPAEPLPPVLESLRRDERLGRADITLLLYWLPKDALSGARRLCKPRDRRPPLPEWGDCSDDKLNETARWITDMKQRFTLIQKSVQSKHTPPVLFSPDIRSRGISSWNLQDTSRRLLLSDLYMALSVP